ncbi:MAG: extracellular solute-binding protein, partial [Kiritimatiellae bacterium]|nr:extracellular solute-binding protein [Kiritimatiellia bacterium]
MPGAKVRFFKTLLPLAALVPMLAPASAEVSFLFCYNPDHPEEPSTRRVIELAKENPEIEPVKWGGLALPGAGGRSTFMLALAGGTAPDIYKAWFHILRHDVAQGFVYPLDEWTAPAAPSDLWDRVRTFDGHVWALPTPGTAYYGIVYRKDLVRAAGLDPESPPKTWSGFREWCVRLTRPGRRAFAIENRPWGFLPWVQSAGGDVIREVPGDGRFEACFDSPAAVKAAEFLQELVRLEVVRGLPTLTVADDIGRIFSAGEAVAVFGGEDLVLRLTETLDMPSEDIGLMPFPACDEGGVRVLQAHRHFYAMSESVGRRPKEERDLVWKCLSALASPELADADVRRNVAEGRARWCRPADLERLGFSDEVAALPQGIRDMYADLDRGDIKAVTEPWVGFWQGASDLVQRRFLGLLLSDAGKDLDCAAALRSITEDANRGLMFDADKSSVERARPFARIILGAIVFCAAVAAWLAAGARRAARRA